MKKYNQAYLFPILLIVSFPFISYGINGKFEKKQYGPYKVSLSQDFKSGLGSIVIKKGNDKVFEEAGIENHYSFGNDFDQTSNGPDIHSGHDITGNGFPNLVISNWTGGAHCCHLLHIFELGKNFKKLATVTANSSTVRLIDLDHDGFPEIEFWDGAIDYHFASFAGSPGGRVILKFKIDHYEVATDLMKKPNPATTEVNSIKKNILAAFKKDATPDLPYEFLKMMIDLSYSGHFEQSLKLANEVWPAKKPGLETFKAEFVQALHESLYWKAF